ncbi:MAG: hypothetical protein J5518_11420 [Lachnospiraceae bacterium]|nr:hypothetical protein [Lachnospiraceae bacterium]
MSVLKKSAKRLITGMLVAAMLATSAPGYAFAAETADNEEILEAVAPEETEDAVSVINDGNIDDEEILETVAPEEAEAEDAPVEAEGLLPEGNPDGDPAGDVTTLTEAYYEASQLQDDGAIKVACDTEIHIGAGVNKTINSIKNANGTKYDLTISGDDTGTLTITDEFTFNYNKDGQKITISGGTINCKKMLIGDTDITGGTLNADQIVVSNHDLSVSGGEVNVHNSATGSDWALTAKLLTVSGGEVNVEDDGSECAIFCGDTCTISGGVVNATAYADGSKGITCNNTVTISDDAYVTASGKVESVYSGGGIVIDGMSATDTSGGGEAVVVYGADSVYHFERANGSTVNSVHIEKSGGTYAIVTDAPSAGIGFADTQIGLAAPDAATVTVTNNSTGTIGLTGVVSNKETSEYVIGDFSGKYLLKNETATFTVQPDELLAIGEHNETFTVTTDHAGVTASFSAAYTVTPSPKMIELTSEAPDFGLVKRDYEGKYTIETKTVTIKNTGTEDLTIGTSVKPANFSVKFPTNLVLSAGESADIEISPKTGLAAGVYDEDWYVTTTDGVKALVPVSLEIKDTDYSIEADQTQLAFGKATVGYALAPSAQKVKITNKGDGTVELIVPTPSDYTVTTTDSLILGKGQSATFSVQPKTGLMNYFSHNANILFKTKQKSQVTVRATFDVGYYLIGEMKASDLIDNQTYRLVDDATILIDATTDKTIKDIRCESDSDTTIPAYELTVTGNDSGKLTVTGSFYHNYISHEETEKKLTISGGTLTCGEIWGKDIDITGGVIQAKRIYSPNHTVSISGGKVTAYSTEQGAAIQGRNISITGGEVYATSTSNSGTGTGRGLYGRGITIKDKAFVLAKGSVEAIYFDGGPKAYDIAESMQMTEPSGEAEDKTVTFVTENENTGHLANQAGDLVKEVQINPAAPDNTNGAAISVEPMEIDFGDVFIEQPTEARAVVIKNTGDVQLTIDSVQPAGEVAFVLGDLSKRVLDPGETATLSVRPDETKIRTEDRYIEYFTVNTNIPSVKFDFYAVASGVWPEHSISVTPSTADFGSVPKGYDVSLIPQKTITVTNTGNVNVALDDPIPDAGTYFEAGSISKKDLAPGESATFALSVTGDATAEAAIKGDIIKIPAIAFPGLSYQTDISRNLSASLDVKEVKPDGIFIDSIPDQMYTGSAIKPEVDVYFNGTKLTDKDYSVSYKNNVNACVKDKTDAKGNLIAPVVIVKGKGNFEGTATESFTITPLDISLATASDIVVAYKARKAQFGETTVTYELNGKTVKLAKNKDFEYVYEDGKDYTEPGVYTTTIRGINNYRDSDNAVTFKQTIAEDGQTLITKVSVPSIPDQAYTGRKKILTGMTQGFSEEYAVDKKGNPFAFTIKNGKTPLTYGVDYTLSIVNNREIGTATVTIEAKKDDDGKYTGDYAGSRTVTFKIKGTDLKGAKVENFVNNVEWTGAVRKQDAKFFFMNGKERTDLYEGKDYRVVYLDAAGKECDPVEIGSYSAVYTGMGYYTGTVKKQFQITGIDMKNVTIPDFTESTGSFTSTVTYKSCYDQRAKAFVYTGMEYKPVGLAHLTTAMPREEMDLTFHDKQNNRMIHLKNGEDYYVTYENNTDPGTATVIFTGMGQCGGTVKKTFKIKAYNEGERKKGYISIAMPSGSLYAYTKGGVKPEPVVTYKFNYEARTLQNNVDYTLKWSDNNAVTTDSTRKMPKVTISFKGRFAGTDSKEFTIKAGKLNTLTVDAVTTDVVCADKAGICKTNLTLTDKKTGAKLAAGTDYEKDIVYKYGVAVDVNVKGQAEKEHRNSGDPVGQNDIIPGGTNGTKINVFVVPKGAYAGDGTEPVNIASFYFLEDGSHDLSKATITINNKPFTGSPISLENDDIWFKFGKEPAIQLLASDYELIYEKADGERVDKGKYNVTIIAKHPGAYGNRKTVSFQIVAKTMDYNVHFESNLATESIKERVYDTYKGDSPLEKDAWFEANCRITGTMKDAVITKGGKLPKNAFMLQVKTVRNGREKWIDVPGLTFKGWNTEADGNGYPSTGDKVIPDKGVLSLSWLRTLICGDKIDLYGQWQLDI